MIFWKTSEVTKEEMRIAEARKLYEAGQINAGEYLDAINQLKRTGEGGQTKSTSAGVLDTVQLGMVVALVGAAVYVLSMFKK